MARYKNLFVSKEELEKKYEETKSIYKVAEFYNKNYKTIISLMDYIITTKEADSSFIADIAASAKVKILYGMDEF